MTNRYPLIINSISQSIEELPAGDNLDLTSSNIVNAGSVQATSFSGDGSSLTNVTANAVAGANVSGTVASATSATVAQTVSNAAQPNITSVGTLTNLYATQYIETSTTPALSGSILTLDLSTCNVFDVSLSASVTTLSITNPPLTGRAFGFTLKLNITGSFSITWPATVKWPSATAPSLTTTAGKVDIFEFFTMDAGVSYYAFVAGQNL